MRAVLCPAAPRCRRANQALLLLKKEVELCKLQASGSEILKNFLVH